MFILLEAEKIGPLNSTVRITALIAPIINNFLANFTYSKKTLCSHKYVNDSMLKMFNSGFQILCH